MSVTAVPLRPISRSALVKLWIGIFAALFAAAALAWSTGSAVTTTESGLRYIELEAGDGGEHPAPTDLVLIDYEGRLADGTLFDSAEQAPMPLANVVPGFAEAIPLMTRGARYRFWLPPELAYGDTPPEGSPIPPGATLEFTVTLHEFISQEQLMQLQMQQMQQGGAIPGAPPPLPGAPPNPGG